MTSRKATNISEADRAIVCVVDKPLGGAIDRKALGEAEPVSARASHFVREQIFIPGVRCEVAAQSNMLTAKSVDCESITIKSTDMV